MKRATNLTLIYHGKFYSEHSQLQLVNADANDAPQWESDSGETTFAECGVAFTVRNDATIEVSIYRGAGKPGGRMIGTGEMTVGAAGLSIGNLFSDADLIDWPSGHVRVTVYVHSRTPWTARKASIVLTPLYESGAVDQIGESATLSARVEQLLAYMRVADGPRHDIVAGALARLGPAAVPALIAATSDALPLVRATALHALGIMRDPRAMAVMISALDDRDEGVRFAGVFGLGCLRDKRATEPLLAHLQVADEGLRMQIALSLGQLRDRRAIAPLLQLLDDEREDLFVREQAARSLGSLKAKEAMPSLVANFRAGDDHFRHAISQAFLALGRSALPAILALAEDDDPAARRMSANAMGSMRRFDVLDALTRLLADTEPDVRRSAAYAVGQLQNPAAGAALLRALRDPDPDVRYFATMALGTLGDRSALPALEELRAHDAASGPSGRAISAVAQETIESINSRHSADR